MVEIILCACGCGKTLNKYDNRNIERKYIKNHYNKENILIQKINIIKCLCGCGTELNEYDNRNRKRQYIQGHTREGKLQSEETKTKIKEANSKRIRSPEEIKRLQELAKQRIGIPLTNEHRFKISLTESRKIAWNKDKTGIYSKELLEKKSLAFRGKNNPRWSDGIQYEPYDDNFTLSFKNIIRKRDNYKCVLCSILELDLKRRLAIHHIDGNKKNTSLQNCVSLCNSCHNKIHSNKLYIQLVNRFNKIIDENREVKSD